MAKNKLDTAILSKITRQARAYSPQGQLDENLLMQMVRPWVGEGEARRYAYAIMSPLADTHVSEHHAG